MWKKSVLAIALLLAIAQVASAASVQYTGQNEDGKDVPVTKDKASS